MASMLILWLFRDITTPSFVVRLKLKLASSPMNVHHKRTGRSPFVIEHVTETDSSRFSSSSPNVNGAIIGRTLRKTILDIRRNKLQNFIRRMKFIWKRKISQTIHSQIAAMLCHSCFVLSKARVVSSMSSFDSFDCEKWNFLACSCYDDSIIRRQVIAQVVL